jgi:hypothetical protein
VPAQVQTQLDSMPKLQELKFKDIDEQPLKCSPTSARQPEIFKRAVYFHAQRSLKRAPKRSWAAMASVKRPATQYGTPPWQERIDMWLGSAGETAPAAAGAGRTAAALAGSSGEALSSSADGDGYGSDGTGGSVDEVADSARGEAEELMGPSSMS